MIYIKDIKFNYPIKVKWSIPINFKYLNTFIDINTILECNLTEICTKDEYDSLNLILEPDNLKSLIGNISFIHLIISEDIIENILEEIVKKLQILSSLKQISVHLYSDQEYEKEKRKETIYKIFKILKEKNST